MTIPPEVQAAIDAGSGRIAELVEIELAAGTLRYTSADISIVQDGVTYYPRGFAVGEIMRTLSQQTQSMRLTFDDVDGGALRSAALQGRLKGRPLYYKFAFLDENWTVIGGAGGILTLWGGKVSSWSLDFQNVVVEVEGWMLALSRLFLRSVFGPSCRWVFRDDMCGYTHVDAEKTAQAADSGCTATVINDSARTEAASWWAGGYLVFTTGDAAGVYVPVKASDTGVITLKHALPAAPAAGDLYSIYQGCDKSHLTCRNKFANDANYGGFQSLTDLDLQQR